MRKSFLLLLATCVAASAADSSLTIYNQDFAVVRQTLSLDLHEGMNEVRFSDTTAHLEPSSVILRDPAGKVPLQILEQNYRADPITQSAMLSQFEGDDRLPDRGGSQTYRHSGENHSQRLRPDPHRLGRGAATHYR